MKIFLFEDDQHPALEIYYIIPEYSGGWTASQD